MRKTKETNLAPAVIAGVMLSILVTSILAAILCGQLLNERIGEGKIPMLAPIMSGVAAGLGTILAGKIAGRSTLMIATITGLVYWISLILVGMLVLDGAFNGLVSGTIAIAVGMLAAILVLIFPVRRKGNRKKLSR